MEKKMKPVMIMMTALLSSAMSVSHAQWLTISNPHDVELRGLSAVNERLIWASGNKGTILRSTDGAHSQKLNAPKPAGEGDYDFRDIEAFSAQHAIVMSAGSGSASSVWQTLDGGATWQNLLTNKDETGFWNAIAFWDKENGFIFGDAVDGRFQIWLTKDSGKSWQLSPRDGMPLALEGEAAFAASGTCAVSGRNGRLAFVTGAATRARSFVSYDYGQHFIVADLPIPATTTSQGAFSILWLDDQTLMAVGGDYKQTTLAGINAAISRDAGKTWQTYAHAPQGFLSGVAMIESRIAVTGLAGSVIGELDHKMKTIAPLPLNAIAVGGKTLFAAGPKGRLVKLDAAKTQE